MKLNGNKKIIRLTESDLRILVSKIIEEQQKKPNFDCYGYGTKMGFEFGNDGGGENVSPWWEREIIKGLWLSGVALGDGKGFRLIASRYDNKNDTILFPQNITNQINNMVKGMGGVTVPNKNNSLIFDFPYEKCKSYFDCSAKVFQYLKTIKKM